METIPPKDKAFLDIKLVQESHASRIAIAFADWLISEGYYPYEQELGRWRNIKDGISTWVTSELYNKFTQQ